jgi:hypothetical protein
MAHDIGELSRQSFEPLWNEFDAAGMMRQLQAPAAKLRT